MEDKFYIQSSFGILELTATTDINVSDNSSISSHKLESGVDVSDHVVNSNSKVTFSGLISDVKQFKSDLGTSESLNVEEYFNLLTRIRDSKEPFTVVYDVRFPPLKNCVFSGVNKTRTSSVGTGYNVTVSIEQLRLSSRSQQTVRLDDQLSPDETQGKTESRNSETQQRVFQTPAALAIGGLVGDGSEYVLEEKPEGKLAVPITTLPEEEGTDG